MSRKRTAVTNNVAFTQGEQVFYRQNVANRRKLNSGGINDNEEILYTIEGEHGTEGLKLSYKDDGNVKRFICVNNTLNVYRPSPLGILLIIFSTSFIAIPFHSFFILIQYLYSLSSFCVIHCLSILINL